MSQVEDPPWQQNLDSSTQLFVYSLQYHLSDISADCWEQFLSVFIDITDLPSVCTTSTWMMANLGGRSIWRYQLEKKLPRFVFGLELFDRPHRSTLLGVYPLLLNVEAAVGDQVCVYGLKDLHVLCKALVGIRRTASAHMDRGGQVAGVFVAVLQFCKDMQQDTSGQDIRVSQPIRLPLSPQLQSSLQADDAQVVLQAALINGKLNVKLEGLSQTTGICLDMAVKDPALTLCDRFTMSSTSSPPWLWQRSRSGLCVFLRGKEAGDHAMMVGVICAVCLREADLTVRVRPQTDSLNIDERG